MAPPPLRRHHHLNQDSDNLLSPAEFAMAVEQTASVRVASSVSAHTASQFVSIVIVLTADQPAAVAASRRFMITLLGFSLTGQSTVTMLASSTGRERTRCTPVLVRRRH